MSLQTWGISLFLRGKLPKFVYRMIGKKLAQKIGLIDDTKGDKMTDNIKDTPPIPTKIAWYRSKTIWTAVVAALLGLAQPAAAALGHPEFVVPDWVYSVLAGFGLYSLRTSTQAIK